MKSDLIKMNASSLVDLKAELARKHEQFQKDRHKNASGFIRAKATQKKTTVWSKQNAGVNERAQRDAEEVQEERDALAASRSKLEEKARLYDKLTGSLPEDSTSKALLVDFEKKTVDAVFAHREEERRKEEEKKKEEERKELEAVNKLLQEKVPEPQDADEQWVDYVDSLGRSRRCLKKDLPHLQQLDAELQGNKIKSKTECLVSGGKELMSADMIREEQRLKWEKEAEEESNGPLHYANVRHNEIRSHGVGFFEFAKEEEERAKQMESLNKLRTQTVDQRDKKERLKAKRQAMLQDRLAKVRQRKLVKEGGVPVDEAFDMIGPKPTEASAPPPELLTRDKTLQKEGPQREWDKGKSVVDLEETYVEKRRDEREDDFAPPHFYYDPPKSKFSNAKLKTDVKAYSTDLPSNLMDSIDANLHAIRTKVENKTEEDIQMTTETLSSTSAVDLSDIPLPTSSAPQVSHHMADYAATSVDHGPVSQHLSDTHTPGHYIDNTGNYFNPNAQFLPQPHTMPMHLATYGYPPMQYGLQECVTYAGPPPAQPPQENVYGYAYNMEVNEQSMNTLEPLSSEPTVHNHSSIASSCQSSLNPTVLEPTADTCSITPSQATPQPSVVPANETSSSDAGVVKAGPQPAHYASGPSKPQVKKAKYQHIPIHQLPPSLPAPPTTGGTVQYPSQEEIFGSVKSGKAPKEITEEDAMKRWQRQFQFKAPKTESQLPCTDEGASVSRTECSSLRPANIPFASPYIQIKEKEKQTDIKFDPSKPPPLN